MPFAKGNKLWKEGLKVREEKRDKIDEFLRILANGGIEKYADIMDKLARDESLSERDIEYMDRFEGWREYMRPKLARKEVTGKGGGPVEIKSTNYANAVDIPAPPLSVEDNGSD